MESKYSLYRRIRQERTYRTLGKMSWWRVLLGTLLLVSILFFTGIVSRPYAAKGDFRTAKILLITPAWMAHYHPDDLAYLDAGVLYQDGCYAAAMVNFRSLETEAARIMYSRSALRLAEEKLAAGDRAGAAEAFAEVDAALLPEEDAALRAELAASLGA